jgi:ATP-dependent Clp protease, protease subunit
VATEAEAFPKEAYVSFSAEINPSTGESLIATMANLANQGVEQVTLALSTPGGGVPKGLTIYNTLRAMPFELITHNVGNVDSIGNAIFLAGDQRYACPHSTFMFHGVAAHTGEGAMLDRRGLEERTDGVLADEKRIGAIIEERTTLSGTEVESLFEHAQTKDAAYAAGAGIVHEIKDIEFTPSIPIISLVFER